MVSERRRMAQATVTANGREEPSLSSGRTAPACTIKTPAARYAKQTDDEARTRQIRRICM